MSKRRKKPVKTSARQRAPKRARSERRVFAVVFSSVAEAFAASAKTRADAWTKAWRNVKKNDPGLYERIARHPGDTNPHQSKRGAQNSDLFVSVGMFVHDSHSEYRKFRTGVVRTHYHKAQNAGLAQLTAVALYGQVQKGTRVEPDELVVRLRAKGGSRDNLLEILEFHKEAFAKTGHASNFRTVRNADGSLDGELRVGTNKDYKDTVLELGEFMNFPRKI